MQDAVRLTQLSHKGGCGCKIAPSTLHALLNRSVPQFFPKELLVGTETSDDAAVFQINENQAIVATTDFFMPIVDDPFDFGSIAATNAISDIYAMGGKPLFALALVGMPINTLPMETIRKILEGGEKACAKAGIPIAGGHSIDAPEPMYGLCVIGIVNPKDLKRNFGARPGDKIILGKALGVGVYCSAVKKEKLGAEAYEELLKVTTQLNTPGIRLAQIPEVHALTDVTGFGLLGHLMEICNASHVGAKLNWEHLPVLKKTAELIEQGFVTGASQTNWLTYKEKLTNAADLTPVQRTLLTDPQTSGGLLLACAESHVDSVLALFKDEGFSASVIGTFCEGEPLVSLL